MADPDIDRDLLGKEAEESVVFDALQWLQWSLKKRRMQKTRMLDKC